MRRCSQFLKKDKTYIKIKPIYECRCDERLKTKAEESTCLEYTGLFVIQLLFQFLYQDGHVRYKRTFSIFFTALGRPGTKTEIIIVTINVTSSTTTPFQMKELVFCPIYRISVIETVLWFQSFKPLRK
jgi:hypothetical protein